MTDAINMTAFKVMIQDLLRDELKPIHNSIDALTDQFKCIQNSIDDIKASAEHAHAVADAAITRTTSVEKRTSALELALEECKKKQTLLHEQTLRMEVHTRRENLKFDGVKETRGQNCLRTFQELLTNMEADFGNIPLDRVHRLGPYKPNKESEPRTILVKFTNYADRERVWAKRNALKGTHIWVKEDYPHEIERRRKRLWPYLRAARAGDPNHPENRVTAHLRVNKLVINHQAFSVDNINNVPDFVRSAVDNEPKRKQTFCIQTDELALFFTKESPLSNFYPSSLDMDDHQYNCVEQYLAHKKALLFSEPELAEEILKTSEARDQKRMVRNLPHFDLGKWKQHLHKILKPALKAKFEQNDQLKASLLATGNRLIGEASPSDTLFGIGLSLSNPAAVVKTRWTGDNIQGFTLMEVRELLK